ncbi:MAG TPA: HD-GYP domain-containing protein [Gaiellaceae bacterium]|nr:HD-GYP domain-containing protein [Gaiellaceae bacterium]
MRLLLRERLLPAVALIGAGAAGPAMTLHTVGGDPATFSGTVHFVAVGISALTAAGAAVALTLVGARRDDGRTVLVGAAFTLMTGLLAVHGLATPGVLIGDNGVVSLTGAATLPAGGAVLALTALPALRRPRRLRPLLALEAASFVVVVGLGVTAIAFPALVPPVPEASSPPALAFLGLGMAFYCLLLLRALKTYLLTRRPTDLAITIGVAWLAAALPPAMTMSWADLGWWVGHGFELAGIVVVGSSVAVDLMQPAPSHPLVGDLRGHHLVAQEEAFLGARVRSLTLRLAEKDESTEEHTRRVALRAVQVGEELGLAPGRLRALAIGGLLHDIGKLSVPERILKKPAGLTDAEFGVIKRHPEWGERLLRELGGFGEPVRRLVRSHHERLDGSGYPDGLRERELDADTRIMAVCDVYDALVSPRVYRDAWDSERALDLLRDGSSFDQRCVAALERVLLREQPASQGVSAPWLATV